MGLLNELDSILNIYTFLFCTVVINFFLSWNFRFQLIKSKCLYANNLSANLFMVILLGLLASAVTLLSSNIAHSIAEIWFFDTPDPIRMHYIRLVVIIFTGLSSLLFRVAIMFINQNGNKLLERYCNMTLLKGMEELQTSNKKQKKIKSE